MQLFIQALSIIKKNVEQTAEHVNLIEKNSLCVDFIKPNLVSISETLIYTSKLVSSLEELASEMNKEINLLKKN